MALAILPNWLGDLVMVEPAVRVLRERGPVTGVVAPGLAALVEDRGLVDRVEVFDRRVRDRGPGGLLRVGRRLRGESTAYVFGPSLRAAALAAAAGIPRRTGIGGAGRELFLTDARRPSGPHRSLHLVDEWLRLVGSGSGICEWRVGARGEAGFGELRSHCPQLGAGYAVFAASANYGVAKEWPAESFAAVARGLSERAGLVPVFVGAESQAEMGRAAELAKATGGTSLAGQTDLPTFAALLDSARIFVGNDSGPMHLAAALGTPTIGIFGSTSPGWTGPRGPRVGVAGPAAVDCSPCFQRNCPFDRECLTGVSPAGVLDLATFLLDEEA